MRLTYVSVEPVAVRPRNSGSVTFLAVYDVARWAEAITDVPSVGETTAICVRRDKAAFLSGCESHPAISLQPEAIGAVMGVTK